MENKIYTVVLTGGAYEDRFETLGLATHSEDEARAFICNPKGKPIDIQWSHLQEWVDGKVTRSIEFETYADNSDEDNRQYVVLEWKHGENIKTVVPISGGG